MCTSTLNTELHYAKICAGCACCLTLCEFPGASLLLGSEGLVSWVSSFLSGSYNYNYNSPPPLQSYQSHEGREIDGGSPFRTEHSMVSHCLHILHMWGSVFILIYFGWTVNRWRLSKALICEYGRMPLGVTLLLCSFSRMAVFQSSHQSLACLVSFLATQAASGMNSSSWSGLK